MPEPFGRDEPVLETRPGLARVAALVTAWLDYSEQLAFELTAHIETANSRSLISESSEPCARARRAAAARLIAAGADPQVLASAGLVG